VSKESVADILAPGAPKPPVTKPLTVADGLDLPVAPAPVKYRAFDDAVATREAMQENILKSMQGRYPIENQRHRLALENAGWAGADKFSLKEQKQAIMRGESLDRRMEGDWVLYDKGTGSEIERRKTTIAHVPYLTNRGTFIYHGNEYTVGNQLRLKPGVYTRVKENGILEAHVNVRPGTGPSFRVYMEPDTGIFRLGLGQSELKLYPILKSMGVSDKDLEKYWGRELMMRNVEAEDPRATARAFHKLVGTLDEEPPEGLETENEAGSEKEAGLRSDSDAEIQEGLGRVEEVRTGSSEAAERKPTCADHDGSGADSVDGRGSSAWPASAVESDVNGIHRVKEAVAHGAREDSARIAHASRSDDGHGAAVSEGSAQREDLSGASSGGPVTADYDGAGSGSAAQGGLSKRAATEAGARLASKWVAPIFGAAAVPVGARISTYGYGLAGLASKVRPDITRTKEIAQKFEDRFGVDAIKDYEKFDPTGDSYKQWRMLRRSKFLEPYIQAGHIGLTSPVYKKTEGIDVVRRLRQMTGTWKNYQSRHYGAFTASPREAFKVLTTEGTEETKVKGLNDAMQKLLGDYDRLAEKHGPYDGLRRLYNEPWAKVDLSNPASVKKFVDVYGQDQLNDVKKKQALLFYASKAKLYAPKWYGALTSASTVAGHGMGLGGAALAGVGGYKALAGLARMLKRGEAVVPEIPPVISTPSAEDAAKVQEGSVVRDLVAGANPFSMKVDTMGVPFKPENRKEELKRVIPAVLGKGLVGAIVVPSMVRSGVELTRGLSRQGPYAKFPGRLQAGAAGALQGAVIPFLTLLRAFRGGRLLKNIEKGKALTSKQLKALTESLGEAPLRSSKATSRALPELKAGRTISPELALAARRELFEPNTTIILNALLGGGITGYAGYSSYKRGKRLREAFEQVYGKELPPEVAAVIMDPKKLKELARLRRDSIRAERHSAIIDRMQARHQARAEPKQE